jgi:predicted transcriptional regulator
MQGHRRGEIEIIRDILEVCLRGANKTKIVYSANLNFSRLEKYFRTLLSLGFIAEEDDPAGSIVYRTTKAGMDFLSGCLKIQKSLPKAPVEVNSRI